jgi:hypothetical protein
VEVLHFLKILTSFSKVAFYNPTDFGFGGKNNFYPRPLFPLYVPISSPSSKGYTLFIEEK